MAVTAGRRVIIVRAVAVVALVKLAVMVLQARSAALAETALQQLFQGVLFTMAAAAVVLHKILTRLMSVVLAVAVTVALMVFRETQLTVEQILVVAVVARTLLAALAAKVS